MGFFNPYGQQISFVEETFTGTGPGDFNESLSFDLAESYNSPNIPVAETMSFDLAESVST
jgi:hypothetical protein